MKKLFDYIVYLILFASFKAVSIIPRPLCLSLGRLIGLVLFYTKTLRYDLVIFNLKTAFDSKSDDEIKALAKSFYKNFGMMIMELPSGYAVSEKFVDEYIDFEGTEFLETVLKKGKGLVILTAHFGNWELLGAALGVKGYNVNTVYRPLDNVYLDRFIRRLRSSTGNDPIDKANAVKRLLGMGKSGEIIGMLMDQRSSFKESVEADFMGHKVRTNKGLAMVGLRSKSENITPVFIVRDGLKHKVIIERALKLKDTGNKEKDILENTEMFNRVIVKYIEKYPDQWLWLHSRWDRRKRVGV